MADNSRKSPIAKQFGGLPLKALIGAPLKAAADANGMMARTQTQFLLSTCFNKSEDNPDVLHPIMIKLRVERSTINTDGVLDKPLVMDFSVPLMTLIPINSLAVEKLNIAFEMEVKSSTQHNAESSEDSKNSTSNDLSKDYRGQQFTSEMHGTLASKSSDSSSSSAKYEISLEAGQLPLPKGITTIIDVFTQNIAPITNKNKNEQ